ncbi:MAG: DUF5017 domain-containing protein [Prevotella sp.]|nr:DUF5017 domain-containing protein [Prevotella sp.]
MKKQGIIKYVGLLLFTVLSCTEEAPDAQLSVSLDMADYQAGEPVTFHIQGEADNIVFYSGEQGHEYDKRDRFFSDNDLKIEIVTYTDFLTYVHPNMQCLVSTDFDGVYDLQHLQAATWVDITSALGLATTVKTNTTSEKISLKAYASDTPSATLYIAFRYYDMNGKGERNRWVVRSINVEKVTPDGQITQEADMKTMAWQSISVSGKPVWKVSSSQLLAAGDNTTSDKDEWVVSQGFKFREAEPSTGVVLKNMSTTLSEFRYTYTTPGVYKAVFVSTSQWYNSSSSSKSQIEVVIK